MSAPVVADGLSNSFRDDGKVSDQGIDVQRLNGFVAFESCIEVATSLMMLPMMNFHGSAVKVRFESIAEYSREGKVCDN